MGGIFFMLSSFLFLLLTIFFLSFYHPVFLPECCACKTTKSLFIRGCPIFFTYLLKTRAITFGPKTVFSGHKQMQFQGFQMLYFSLRNSFMWPFLETFVPFFKKTSGNSENALKRKLHREHWTQGPGCWY